ncbi:MAG: HAD family hydrolase [Oscillospiraceae bacterium]|nr:HAD family hydrolase [Oscillospiraceae bacterium]
MKKPKMIIFDCGHTLLGGRDFNPLRGGETLFNYIKHNRNALTPKQVDNFSANLFKRIRPVHELNFELHEWQFQRFLYEYLEIELSISWAEAEKIFWDSTYPSIPMPDVDKVIDFINSIDIRSGVISNVCFSGSALSEKINRLLPHNKFEFIITSSEYMFRKPEPMIFELALKKAINLNAEDVWFCGDSIKEDIEGASNVGFFPVWYENTTIENVLNKQDKKITPNCEYLHIHRWDEFIKILMNLK